MNRYTELKGLLSRMADIVLLAERAPKDIKDQLDEDIKEYVTEMNRTLFGFERIEADFPMEWVEAVENAIIKRETAVNNFDEEFYRMMDVARWVPFEDIVSNVKKCFREKSESERRQMELYYQIYHYFWGTLEPNDENYEVIENRIKMLKVHVEDFEWLYGRLSDYRSKRVLIKFVEYWLTMNLECIEQMLDLSFEDYFDLDLVSSGKDAVFVDLGGYNGDSIEDFVKTYGEYRSIYTFEVSPYNVEAIKMRVGSYNNLHIIQKAAGEKRGTIQMKVKKYVASDNSEYGESGGETEERTVEITTVDDEVSEPVTLIKMDIEGAEADALLGCRRHIIEDHPQMMICVYHNNEDIWKIARMISEIDDSYRFFLRSNGRQLGPAEIVLHAL